MKTKSNRQKRNTFIVCALTLFICNGTINLFSQEKVPSNTKKEFLYDRVNDTLNYVVDLKLFSNRSIEGILDKVDSKGIYILVDSKNGNSVYCKNSLILSIDTIEIIKNRTARSKTSKNQSQTKKFEFGSKEFDSQPLVEIKMKNGYVYIGKIGNQNSDSLSLQMTDNYEIQLDKHQILSINELRSNSDELGKKKTITGALELSLGSGQYALNGKINLMFNSEFISFGIRYNYCFDPNSIFLLKHKPYFLFTEFSGLIGLNYTDKYLYCRSDIGFSVNSITTKGRLIDEHDREWFTPAEYERLTRPNYGFACELELLFLTSKRIGIGACIFGNLNSLQNNWGVNFVLAIGVFDK